MRSVPLVDGGVTLTDITYQTHHSSIDWQYIPSICDFCIIYSLRYRNKSKGGQWEQKGKLNSHKIKASEPKDLAYWEYWLQVVDIDQEALDRID